MFCREVREAIRTQASENGVTWRQIIAAMRGMPPANYLCQGRDVEVVEKTPVMKAVHAACQVAEQFRGKSWKTA